MAAVVGEDGTLRLPLYHGTSSYFWPLIKQHGLGGVNIVHEWRLIPLLREALAALAEVDHPEIAHEMRLRLPILNSIAEQRVSGGGFNWRHGSVYLTLCPRKAVSYGCRGFGSELLGQVAETLELLARVRPDAAAALLLQYPEAASARSSEHRPVLIRVDGIHLDRLRGEDGDDPQGDFRLAETFIELGDSEPQVSFELVGVAQVTELSAAEVEVTDWGYGLPKAWTSKPLI